ncbi:pyrroline-5-carboxylate reductase [Suicoccus acidiformans]|nr:pyrroline-5-carboxylate reductase [Suicoccus acidiformans]
MMNGVGFIGVGNMASAIAKAVRASKPEQALYLYNRTPERIYELSQALNAFQVERERLDVDLLARCEYIFVGVKPYGMKSLFEEELAPYLSEDEPKVWISMAVGYPLKDLKTLTPASHRWIRIMPNTPVEFGEGYVSYCYDPAIEASKVGYVEALLQEAGRLQYYDESQFDAAGAVAGSGPAFIYQVIEALSDAAVSHGIPRQEALEMAAQTVVGAGQMVLASGENPGALKDRVTSPGGTTIAGVKALEANGLRHAMISAVDATYQRSVDLSDQA